MLYTGDAYCNGNWHSLWNMGKHAYSLVVSYDIVTKCSRRSCSVNIESHMAHRILTGSTFEGSRDSTARRLTCVNGYRNFVGSSGLSLMDTSAVTASLLIPASTLAGGRTSPQLW